MESSIFTKIVSILDEKSNIIMFSQLCICIIMILFIDFLIF